MKNVTILIMLLAAALISTPAVSGAVSEALGVCMIDSLTGKERKQLAQWVFFGMSAHPEISRFSNVTEASKNETDQFVGQLVTRLLTEDCPAEARLALNSESSLALQTAFGLVGQVAMQELMNDKNVATSMSNFEQYLDKHKLNALAGVE